MFQRGDIVFLRISDEKGPYIVDVELGVTVEVYDEDGARYPLIKSGVVKGTTTRPLRLPEDWPGIGDVVEIIKPGSFCGNRGVVIDIEETGLNTSPRFKTKIRSEGRPLYLTNFKLSDIYTVPEPRPEEPTNPSAPEKIRVERKIWLP